VSFTAQGGLLCFVYAAVGKIEARKMKESNGVATPQRIPVSAGIEDFCDTFERTVKPVVVSVPPVYCSQQHSSCYE